jgi:hypothetical protein
MFFSPRTCTAPRATSEQNAYVWHGSRWNVLATALMNIDRVQFGANISAQADLIKEKLALVQSYVGLVVFYTKLKFFKCA